MNHIEKKVRYSNAFSSLNSLRNKIAFKDSSIMNIEDENLILEAIEIATESTEGSFKKALLYSFYNTGDTIKASALELAKVLDEGMSRGLLDDSDIKGLKDALSPIPFSNDRKNLVSKIDSLMILLNKAKKEEVLTSNSLRIKGLNTL